MSTAVSNPTTEETTVRRSLLDREVAMELAATEYERFAIVATDLSADDWGKPTDCPAWDVRRLASHVLGMAKLAADEAEGDRQRALAFASGPADGLEFTDALTAVQVREHENCSPAEIVAGLLAVGPRAAQGRKLAPDAALSAQLPVPFEFNKQTEQWAVGYLIDIILTRDVWMHRVDISRATGRPMTLTADHDGAIVADVVTEWANRHGKPYRLTLTGPAGGSFAAGHDGKAFEIDAIEFCRILSGRGAGTGLLTTSVPF